MTPFHVFNRHTRTEHTAHTHTQQQESTSVDGRLCGSERARIATTRVHAMGEWMDDKLCKYDIRMSATVFTKHLLNARVNVARWL